MAIYRYQDLYVAKINAQYDLQWCRKIPKYQSEKAAFSYRYIHDGKDHLFIFNDNPDNLQLKKTESPSELKLYSDGVLMAYRIADKDGTAQQAIALNYADYSGLELTNIDPPRDIYDMGEGSFVFLNKLRQGGFVLFRVRGK